MSKTFVLSSRVTVCADKKMQNNTVKNLFKSFCLGDGEITFTDGPDNTFRLGETTLPTLPEGKEYAITVDENGIAIVGDSYGGLMRGFMVMLMQIDYTPDSMFIPAGNWESEYRIKNRMIHICVFPDNPRHFTRKMLRLAGLCQYTHVVLEFWGMLKYDCMKELSWPQAFTKAQAGELIKECRELGIEPVPMFNQLGHATASRVIYGKHVVLDQNPRLQRLFTADGWAWNIQSDEVVNLLRAVRKELYELFGEGEYMHIGCDEAYIITQDEKLRKFLPEFLKNLTCEVEKEGRRPMLWMDMLLEKDAFEKCYTAGYKDEVENLRNSTADSTVFVDWQYSCTAVPIPSLASLKDCGKDVMGAPWYDYKNCCAHIDTIVQNDLFGIMVTTWDALKNKMRSIVSCADRLGASMYDWTGNETWRTQTAVMFRRVSFEGNNYEECGFAKQQIDV
jgi:hypothetical protein